MTKADLENFVRASATVMRELVEASVGPLAVQVKQIDARPPVMGPQGQRGDTGDRGVAGERGEKGEKGEKGERGERGADGQSIDPDVLADLRKEIEALRADLATFKALPPIDVEAIAAPMIAKAIADLPTPHDGKHGEPGKDADPDLIKALVAEAVAAIPTPENGKDGSSVSLDDVTPIIAAEVSKAVAALPVPKDGEDGQDGKDGVGLAGALIDKDGALVVTLSDGAVKALGPVCGRNGERGEEGADGKDGADGLGFDDLAVEHDGERTFTLQARQGDRVKALGSFTVPAQIYRGVFVDGSTYAKGDTVTWAGALWHANDATTAKPGLNTPESRAWQLAVKKGQDGKEGRPGKDGAQGPIGLKGEPGRNGY